MTNFGTLLALSGLPISVLTACPMCTTDLIAAEAAERRQPPGGR